jgi:coenzyme F420-0:L-glutamate ligase/coenzyme F420-1:gamma-L-glutamate ligase
VRPVPSQALVLEAVEGLGEITPGTDLAGLLADVVDLRDGDVLVLTSKVVSKAEGRVVEGDRDGAVEDETLRVVARRGGTRIVENRQGLVLAAAGVDASNVAAGSVVLLPEDPDRSARVLREGVLARTGHNVAVVVSDTAGRPWRTGQTDIAIGVAGMAPLEDFAGLVDGYGNALAVTAPAVADELAGAAELVTGKLGGRPLTVARGLAQRVLPPGEHGQGARSLQRPREQDLFALGTREAVVAALAGADGDAFGTPADPADLAAALTRCGRDVTGVGNAAVTLERTLLDSPEQVPQQDPVLAALLHAHRWRVDSVEPRVRLVPLP